MGNEESVVLGGNEVDAEYRPNVSFVPEMPTVSSESELSDEQRLATEEGYAETILFKEEASGEEKKETETPAEETPPEKKEEGAEEGKETVKEEKKETPPVKTDEKEKYSKEVQKRINKITREKYEERRAREKLEAEVQKLKEKLSTSETNKTKLDIESRKPKEDDFEEEIDFHIALGEWAAEKKLAEMEAEKLAATQTTPDETTEDNKPSAAQDAAMETGKEKYDDFEEVVLGAPVLTEGMVNAALESDLAADILYHIGQNQDDAVRIAKLSPTGIAREIGKIEAGLSASIPKTETQELKDTTEESVSSVPSQKTDTPPNRKQTTNAPPPISPITPGASTTTPGMEKLSNREYRAARGFTSGAIKKRE